MTNVTEDGFEIAGARSYSRAEQIVDAAVHYVGVVIALLAVPVLITLAAALGGSGGMIAAVAVYGATLIAMLACSAFYNLAKNPRAREILRRFDHGVIYLKIAGTYTPFAVIVGGLTGIWLLVSVWVVAGIGLALKIFAPRRFEAFSIVLYLALGWAIVVVAGDVVDALSTATLVLIFTGGGLYSIGVIFHLWNRLPFQNAIWHLFVLSASLVFYAAVMVEVIAGH